MSEVFSRHSSARRTPVEYNVISMVRCSRLAEAASNRPTSSRLSTGGSFSGKRGNGFLASPGLRIGEAIGLTMEDARLDATPPHLLIHESKFGKSRYVVLHPSTAEHLRIYRSKRTEVLRDRQVQPFFINRKGGRLDYNSQRL